LLGRGEVPRDDDGRIEIATLAATTFGQVVVLKGHRTVVTDGQRVYLNRTGDSSLSKAGSGDVLSGIIATLLAQEMDRFCAACAGVWIHGTAGELAGKRLGRRSVLARDVIDALPQAIAAYEAVAGVTS
jgi:NAD(P)H-hydrate epimerase